MKICLVMIVKNEAHVLRRAIMSALPYIDFACIVDTGSTKEQNADMYKILRLAFDEPIYRPQRVEYAHIQDEWSDFATNRSLALQAAEAAFPDATHLLMLDADDYIENTPPLQEFDPTYAGFNVNIRNGNIRYPRTQLFKAGMGWHYKGVVHEYPECGTPNPRIGYSMINIVSTREGARSQTADKYQQDAYLIIEALNDNPEPDIIPRYQFYLAQSLENCGKVKEALDWYDLRANNPNGYTEERYVSWLRMARLVYAEGWQQDTALDYCNNAQKVCDYRREAAHLAMVIYNGAERYQEAYDIWQRYPVTILPSGLFVEPATYQGGMHEEAGIAAYYLGLHRTSAKLLSEAISRHPAADHDLKRLIRNLRWPLDYLTDK